MKRLVMVVLVSSLLIALAFAQKENVPAAKASPDVYQGDLILNGNNVTVIENRRFDINGSIIVEDNATLILRNAAVGFTQTKNWQFNMTFHNPVNGNPRLIVENATITSNGYQQHIFFDGNSSASINELTASEVRLYTRGSSIVSISNSTMFYIYPFDYSTVVLSDSVLSRGIIVYDLSCLDIFNCTLDFLTANDVSNVNISNSVIYDYILLNAISANCSISELQPGYIGYWNFELNCSLLAPSGSAVNVTLSDTLVGGWSFQFYGSSNVTVFNSELFEVQPDTSSAMRIYNSSFSNAIDCRGESITHIFNSTTSNLWCQYGSPIVWFENSTAEYAYATDSSTLAMTNCTVSTMGADTNPEIIATNCTITDCVQIFARSGNYSVIGLEPSFVSYWNFKLNCSVEVALTGWAPNVTLLDTQVGGWSFYSQGESNATVSNSKLLNLYFADFSSALIYNSTFANYLYIYDYSRGHLYNTTIQGLYSDGNSKFWFVNSTNEQVYDIRQQSEVCICWYLDVHVVYSNGTGVPFANVTATYPNSTLAESKLADANGWARLTLTEKMMNATGSYPIGNYTITAEYDTYQGQQSVNMTENKIIIIPEFPLLLILPLFMVATLLATVVYRGKQHSP